jgi:CheY-like chemotaxis protein
MSVGPRSEKVVLVVEDDAVVRGAMRMVLEWEGYQVACASDGQEALDYLRTSAPPSLILLDVMMPGVDGWRFQKERQADPTLAGVPVVIISALDADQCPEAAAHIRKPFQPQELLEAIRQQRGSKYE